MMNQIDTGSGTVTYATVRKAMGKEPFTMSLTDSDEIHAVIEAVNEGIDSHLEACYCTERGDRFQAANEKRASSSSAAASIVRSALSRCPPCFAVCANRTKRPEIALPPIF